MLKGQKCKNVNTNKTKDWALVRNAAQAKRIRRLCSQQKNKARIDFYMNLMNVGLLVWGPLCQVFGSSLGIKSQYQVLGSQVLRPPVCGPLVCGLVSLSSLDVKFCCPGSRDHRSVDPCIVDTWSGDHQSWHQVLASSLCIKSLHQATSLAIKYWWLSDKSNDAFDKNCLSLSLELTT